MDYSNKEEVFKALIDWEQENGEDILDGRFGEDILVKTFMIWAVGAGHLSREKFDKWHIAIKNKEYGADDIGDVLYDAYNSDVSEYAIVNAKEGWDTEEYEKAFLILADFITSFTAYQNRFKEFLTNGIW